jgi:hypothetical protein
MIGISGGTAGEAMDRPARVYEGDASEWDSRLAPRMEGDWERRRLR